MNSRTSCKDRLAVFGHGQFDYFWQPEFLVSRTRISTNKSAFRSESLLLARPLRRRSYSAQPTRILRYTFIKTLRHALPILWLLQLPRVLLIGHKRDLRQDRRHIRPDQHHKRSLLHPAILQPRITLLQPTILSR